ncbi:MAG: hypothetical protein ACI9O2_001032, partial [Flammeovirgaceae bacterium]
AMLKELRLNSSGYLIPASTVFEILFILFFGKRNC